MQRVSVFLRIIFLNSLDPPREVYLIAIIRKGVGFWKRLRLGLSHLPEHKFKHNFQNCLNPLCSCGLEIESTSHFLLHCPIFRDKRYTLLGTLRNIGCKLLESTDSCLTETLLFGSTSLDPETNSLILNATIDFILSTKRFEEPLLWEVLFITGISFLYITNIQSPFRISL